MGQKEDGTITALGPGRKRGGLVGMPSSPPPESSNGVAGARGGAVAGEQLVDELPLIDSHGLRGPEVEGREVRGSGRPVGKSAGVRSEGGGSFGRGCVCVGPGANGVELNSKKPAASPLLSLSLGGDSFKAFSPNSSAPQSEQFSHDDSLRTLPMCQQPKASSDGHVSPNEAQWGDDAFDKF